MIFEFRDRGIACWLKYSGFNTGADHDSADLTVSGVAVRHFSPALLGLFFPFCRSIPTVFFSLKRSGDHSWISLNPYLGQEVEQSTTAGSYGRTVKGQMNYLHKEIGTKICPLAFHSHPTQSDPHLGIGARKARATQEEQDSYQNYSQNQELIVPGEGF